MRPNFRLFENISAPGDQQVDQPGLVPGLRRQQSGSELPAPVQVLRVSVGRENQPKRQLRPLFGDRRRPFALHRVHHSGARLFLQPTFIHHQVVSVNSIGVGPPSNTVTATTAEEGELSAEL